MCCLVKRALGCGSLVNLASCVYEYLGIKVIFIP